MLGCIQAELLVTLALVILAHTGIKCRAEGDLLSITLPAWSGTSAHVVQCFSNKHETCDWTSSQRTALGDVKLDTLESHPLEFVGEACLEFWYLAPVASRGSELRALLKSSTGLVEIWTSPALPRNSWKQSFISLTISDPGSQIVFEAVQTVSLDWTTLRWVGVKGGPCGNPCDSATDLWTDSSTRCLCSAGQLSCFPSPCPTKQTCGPQRGDSNGVATSGVCTVHNHIHYTTFDGVMFGFMSPCSYVLAKTCSPTEVLPRFTVEVINKQKENADLPTIQQVVVELGNVRLSILKSQSDFIVVNGVSRKLPLNLDHGTINVRSNTEAVVLETSFGLSVSYNHAGNVHVTVPRQYSDRVCGLCGNFNFLRGDEFTKSDGTTAEDTSAFAESWKTVDTASCEILLVPQLCDPLLEANYGSELYCGRLHSGSGPFPSCLSVIEAESYFRACVSGMCSGDQAVLCETFKAYEDVCRRAGVVVDMWRNSTVCPLQCNENSHYKSCAEGCPEVCSILDLPSPCGSCEERCECDSGFKLSGDNCVSKEHCGCWHKEKHYAHDETFVEGNCVQQCHCMGNAVQCTAMQCGDDEICKDKDGVKGCFPLKPATCSVYGDPHYITFDNSVYDFQGGCSYTLTTTCGEQSSIQFTVTGFNMHPTTRSFTRSKLQAVSLQVADLHLTLNQTRDVYVEDGLVRLPYSTNGTFGTMWIYKRRNSVVLKTTFGLKMEIDGHNRLFLQVDESYKYELCGLCGTYSEYQGDDFLMPNGLIAAEAFEFADSWRVNNNYVCIAHPSKPRECVGEENYEADRECSVVLGDAFQACHEHIHPTIYLSSCVYDYCDTSGDRSTLCESIKSYVAACQVVGVELSNWWIGTACVCPLDCNFDMNICGWEQLIQDSFDWTRHSGPTSSNLTGPNNDHTTGEGFYMYIEGDGVTHGDSARLMSSVCHFGGALCLNFWYYMHGSATSMALNIYLLKNNRATKLWSVRNNQGPEWRLASVDVMVFSPFQIIVEGIRGSDALSDIAIDDISISLGSCSEFLKEKTSQAAAIRPLAIAEVQSSQQMCSLDCSFNNNLCTWSQMTTDAFDWTRSSGSTTTLACPVDHSGDYIHVEASSVTWGGTARLISSECSNTGPQCLQFWYHMYSSSNTVGLYIYLLQNNVADAIWWKSNNQGILWRLAQVNFNTAQNFQVIIEGHKGSNDQSDVAIDEVKLYSGPCSGLSEVIEPHKTQIDVRKTVSPSVQAPTVVPEPPVLTVVTGTPILPILSTTTVAPVVHPVLSESTAVFVIHPGCQLGCDFDTDFCQWSQLLTDVFDWKRHSGPSRTTGPSDYATGRGHYLYIEANKTTMGDTARLISSRCSNTGPQCLQFWYHIYGSANTMGLHVYLLQNGVTNAIWWMRNNQGNQWHLAQIDFNTTQDFQVIIEGHKGSNEESDVSIDDVKLDSGHCSGLIGGTEPHPAPVLNATTRAPVLNATTRAPVLNATTRAPVLNATTRAPVLNATTRAPVLNATTRAPVLNATTRAPVLNATTRAPALNATTRAPALNATTRAPALNATTRAPALNATTRAPALNATTRAPALNATTRAPALNATTRAPALNATTRAPALNATTRAPALNATTRAPALNATTRAPALNATTRAPALNATTRAPAHSPGCQLDCDFDIGFCQWSQLLTDVFDWTRHSGPTSTPQTGPPLDHTSGGGHYLYIEAEKATLGDTARLISSRCSNTGPQCLQFWYHMYGSANTMGLHVYLLQNSESKAIWWKSNNQGNQWHLAQVGFNTTQDFQLIVEGRRGSNEQSDVAIDDIKLHSGLCSGQSGVTAQPTQTDQRTTVSSSYQAPTTVVPGPPLLHVTNKTPNSPVLQVSKGTSAAPVVSASTAATVQPECQLDCDFDTDFCQWSQLFTDAFDWERHSGPAQILSGPTSDHTTGGGHYLYIDAKKATLGGTARLISSKCSSSGPQCLQFWYHMYGSADTMGLHVYLLQDKAMSIWRKKNDQGNMWHFAQIHLITTAAFQVIVEGRLGSTELSNIAIDDIILHEGFCEDSVEPSTTSPVKLSPVINSIQSQISGSQPGSSSTTAKPELTTLALTNSTPRPNLSTANPTTLQPGALDTTPSCAENSHYTTCIPKCSPTCAFMHGPPNCNVNKTCTAGCACNDGSVQKGKYCVPIQECGCVDRNGFKHNFNEVWYTNHCSQKCECNGDRGRGAVNCHDEGCGDDEVCLQSEMGQYYCASTDFSECTIEGDPEYKTFDKMKHDFKGMHLYVLVRTKNLPSNLPEIYIEGTNACEEQSGQSNEEDDGSQSEMERFQELKVTVYNLTVVLKQKHKVFVDGQQIKIPVSPAPGLNIHEHSSRIYLRTDFGFSVEFSSDCKAEIILPHFYKRRVEGLCGNFDGRKINDNVKPDGTTAKSIQELGESWRV
ncbi:MAM and LDL-receptor class A domain-containing protein 1 isoform X2 [Nothobranchius furzeri]|uniref:MAM and LDL-receptor class A domain-containing protein 1 isoform X2 n=1 Tax=Nothobranchius furzeri TaxID=105023 RepID=UPI003904CB76